VNTLAGPNATPAHGADASCGLFDASGASVTNGVGPMSVCEPPKSEMLCVE
jgi:hypothetical protein